MYEDFARKPSKRTEYTLIAVPMLLFAAAWLIEEERLTSPTSWLLSIAVGYGYSYLGVLLLEGARMLPLVVLGFTTGETWMDPDDKHPEPSGLVTWVRMVGLTASALLMLGRAVML